LPANWKTVGPSPGSELQLAAGGLVLEPHAPPALRRADDGRVDDLRRAEVHAAGALPVAQVVAGQVLDAALAGPALVHPGHDGEPQVVDAVELLDLGRPQRGAGALGRELRLAGRTPVVAVVRRRDADGRGVHPADVLGVGEPQRRAAVRVEHLPALEAAVEDEGHVGGAVQHRVAIQRSRRGLGRGGAARERGEQQQSGGGSHGVLIAAGLGAFIAAPR
jgi:hypothetical protein